MLCTIIIFITETATKAALLKVNKIELFVTEMTTEAEVLPISYKTYLGKQYAFVHEPLPFYEAEVNIVHTLLLLIAEARFIYPCYSENNKGILRITRVFWEYHGILRIPW